MFARLLKESFEKNYKKFFPQIEKEFNIKILKKLGEGLGLAYLTDNNTAIKITFENQEAEFFYHLMDNYSRYFPEVFDIDVLVKSKIYAIHKEYVPSMPDEILKKYKTLKKIIYDWTESDNDELFLNILKDLDNTFLEYLNDVYYNLTPLYNDLIRMVDYAKKNNLKSLDIQEDNLGYRSNNLVLFDV